MRQPGPVRRRLAAAALTSVLGASTLSMVGAGGSTLNLPAVLKSSLARVTLPSRLTPSMASATTIVASFASLNNYLVPVTGCDPARHPTMIAAPVACFFGDHRGAHTVVLFGDSSTFAWAYALDAPLRQSHVRLALFEYSGCFSSGLVATATQLPLLYGSCNTWHSALGPAMKALAPVAILSSSAAYVSPTTDTEWISGYQSAFDAVSIDPKVPRLIIGTSPDLAQSAPQCLSRHVSDIRPCNYVESATYQGLLQRDVTLASALGAKLVPSEPWLCLKGQCPVVVNNYLAYRDNRHFFFPFLTYLGPVVAAALRSAGLPTR